jgi:hypothetical protein
MFGDFENDDQWDGDYDGTKCPNCGRFRVLLCVNGKRRCEKCNFAPDAGEYSECPAHVWR